MKQPLGHKIAFPGKTGCNVSNIRKKVLDAVGDMDRFSEICLNPGMEVHAFELGHAVEAARDIIGQYLKLYTDQADVLSLPFARDFFD